MTNFDPGGFLMLLTVIPAIAAGAVSIGMAHLTARLGLGDYETNVAVVLATLLLGWIAAAFVVSTGMLQILAVTLAMAGAYGTTRSVAASSYGWVLGVVLLFVTYAGVAAMGIYKGVDQTGRPQGLLSRHLRVFYYAGLLGFGAVGGKAVQAVRRRWGRRRNATVAD